MINLSGDGGGKWNVSIDNDKCEVKEGKDAGKERLTAFLVEREKKMRERLSELYGIALQP